MRLHVPPEQLWTEFQGDLNFEYDHETYWPALIKMCEDKHAELKTRWINAGKKYGESETYLKGGDVPSVTGFKANQEGSEPQAKNEEAAESTESGPQADAVENSNGTLVGGQGNAVDDADVVKGEDKA